MLTAPPLTTWTKIKNHQHQGTRWAYTTEGFALDTPEVWFQIGQVLGHSQLLDLILELVHIMTPVGQPLPKQFLQLCYSQEPWLIHSRVFSDQINNGRLSLLQGRYVNAWRTD